MDSFRKELKAKAKEILQVKIWPFFLMCLLTMLDAGILVKIFFTSPLKAAYCNFLAANSKNGEETDKGVLWRNFTGNYLKLLKNTFIRDLFLMLWSLPIVIGVVMIIGGGIVLIILIFGENFELFSELVPNMTEYWSNISQYREYISNLIAPQMQGWLTAVVAIGYILMIAGIIIYLPKLYSYYVTDFIIGENPGMKWNEAIKQSKEMMKNYKFFAFKLDLSFIGWYLLAAVVSSAAGGFAFILSFIGRTVIEVYRSTTVAQFYIQKQEQHNVFVCE